MSIKRILAAAAASVVAVSSMAIVASAEEGFSGSKTMKDSAWWTQEVVCGGDDDIPLSNLIGDVDPANIASITFTSDTTFCVGYNSTEGWYQVDNNAFQTSYTFDNIKLETTTNEAGEEEKPYLHLAISKGDGVDYTINWTVNLKEGAAPADPEPEPAPADPDPAPADPEPAAPANNVDTGVEGVAAVLGVAAVAAGAMIVAKKRK